VVEQIKRKDALQFLIRAEWYGQLPDKIKRRASGIRADLNLLYGEPARRNTSEPVCRAMGNPKFAMPKPLCSYADKIIPKVKQKNRFENMGLFRNLLCF
jgi:hypothetical protein